MPRGPVYEISRPETVMEESCSSATTPCGGPGASGIDDSSDTMTSRQDDAASIASDRKLSRERSVTCQSASDTLSPDEGIGQSQRSSDSHRPTEDDDDSNNLIVANAASCYADGCQGNEADDEYEDESRRASLSINHLSDAVNGDTDLGVALDEPIGGALEDSRGGTMGGVRGALANERVRSLVKRSIVVTNPSVDDGGGRREW